SPQDLERQHPLVARGLATLEGGRVTGRQRKLEAREQAEPEVDLPAGIRDRAAQRALVRVGDEGRDEERRARPGQVEAGRPDAPEQHRRQVPLGYPARVVGAGDLVDLEAGEGVWLAVAFLVAVVDPVVAEAAEIEVGEGLLAVAA